MKEIYIENDKLKVKILTCGAELHSGDDHHHYCFHLSED